MITATAPVAPTIEYTEQRPDVLTPFERKLLAAVRRLRNEQKYAMIVVRYDHAGFALYATGAPVRVSE